MLSAALHGGMPNISGFRSSPFPVMPDRAAENLRRQIKDNLEEVNQLKMELSEAKREIFKLQNHK